MKSLTSTAQGHTNGLAYTKNISQIVIFSKKLLEKMEKQMKQVCQSKYYILHIQFITYRKKNTRTKFNSRASNETLEDLCFGLPN